MASAAEKLNSVGHRVVAAAESLQAFSFSFGSQCICIHLKSNTEKFYVLCLMTRKLFALAKGECMEENPDSLVNQEVLTPGQLFLMFLKVNAGCFTPEQSYLLWDDVAISSSIVSCMFKISSLGILCSPFFFFFFSYFLFV